MQSFELQTAIQKLYNIYNIEITIYGEKSISLEQRVTPDQMFSSSTKRQCWQYNKNPGQNYTDRVNLTPLAVGVQKFLVQNG